MAGHGMANMEMKFSSRGCRIEKDINQIKECAIITMLIIHVSTLKLPLFYHFCVFSFARRETEAPQGRQSTARIPHQSMTYPQGILNRESLRGLQDMPPEFRRDSAPRIGI